MATRTITRLYDTHDEAARAVEALEAAGVPHTDIALVGSAHDRTAEGAGEATTGAATGAATGATLGTLVGGSAGLLAGIGAIPIPGVGPVVAAGWLVAALTGAGVGAGVGATAGGLLGSLAGAGVDEEDAHVYAEGVRRGGAVLSARVEESEAARLEAVLAGRGGHVDVEARRAEYQAEGWNRFDPAAPAHTASDVQAERKRRVRVHGARAAAVAAPHQGAEAVPQGGRSVGDAPRQGAEEAGAGAVRLSGRIRVYSAHSARAAADAAAASRGAEAARQGGRSAGAAPRQGAEANADTALGGGEAAPCGGAQATMESQRRVVQDAAERSEEAGREAPRAPQVTTENVRRPVAAPMALPNAAEGGLRDIQQGVTGLFEGVVQTNLRAVQELFRLANPAPVVELQQRFAREYTDALVQNSATLVRAVRRTADEALRPLEEQLRQREQGGQRYHNATE